jgi:queuosine precursor transporter
VKRQLIAAGALTAYVGSVVMANVLTNHLGLVWVFPGLVTTAGTYAAGIALGARDLLQDTAGKWAVRGAIVVAAVLSGWLAGLSLAAASGLAFVLGEGLDMALYTRWRERGQQAKAILVSNTFGALLDTLVFLSIATPTALHVAPGQSKWDAIPGQLVGKILWATVPFVIIVAIIRKVRRGAVSRDAVGA